MADTPRRETFADEVSWQAYLRFEQEIAEQERRDRAARERMSPIALRRLERKERRRREELGRRARRRERERRKQEDELLKAQRAHVLATTLGISEVAKLVGVSRQRVEHWIKSGRLESQMFTVRASGRAQRLITITRVSPESVSRFTDQRDSQKSARSLRLHNITEDKLIGYSMRDASRILGVPYSTIGRWVKNGKLEAVQVTVSRSKLKSDSQTRIRIKQDALQAFTDRWPGLIAAAKSAVENREHIRAFRRAAHRIETHICAYCAETFTAPAHQRYCSRACFMAHRKWERGQIYGT